MTKRERQNTKLCPEEKSGSEVACKHGVEFAILCRHLAMQVTVNPVH